MVESSDSAPADGANQSKSVTDDGPAVTGDITIQDLHKVKSLVDEARTLKKEARASNCRQTETRATNTEIAARRPLEEMVAVFDRVDDANQSKSHRKFIISDEAISAIRDSHEVGLLPFLPDRYEDFKNEWSV